LCEQSTGARETRHHRSDRHVGDARYVLVQSQGSSTAANIASIYAGLGDNDKAMIWLNKAYQARFNPSILLRPVFDPLRSDLRFQDLLRRIGLPSR